MAKSMKSTLNSYKKQYKKANNAERKRNGLKVNRNPAFYEKHSPTSTTYTPKKPSKNVKVPKVPQEFQESKSGGCYIATCVYGSYDCPQVWILRRYRDNVLDETWYGRLFIRCYYSISPTLVKWFGERNWFKTLWRGFLDKMILGLTKKGLQDTPYNDK